MKQEPAGPARVASEPRFPVPLIVADHDDVRSGDDWQDERVEAGDAVRGASAFRGAIVGTDQVLPLALGIFAALGIVIRDDDGALGIPAPLAVS